MNKKTKIFLDLCVVSLLLLGALTIIGWIYQIDHLVKISSTFSAMTLGTAICFIISGVLFFLVTYPKIPSSKNCSLILVALLLVISSAYLVEHILNLNLWIDFADYHQRMGSNGRTAINSASGFFLFALGVLALMNTGNGKYNNFINKLPAIFAIFIMLIGVTSLLGYFLNLHEVYNWNGFSSMAIHTAFGFLVMGVGLYVVTIEKNKPSVTKNYEKRILVVTFIVMIVTSLGISILSFNVMQKRIESALIVDISNRAEGQSAFIYQIIAQRWERSSVLSKNADILSIATLLSKFPRDQRISNEISALNSKYKINGFDLIEFELAENAQLAHQPSLNNNELQVDLNGRYKGRLLWSNGYFLISQNPIHIDGKLIVYLVTKQHLQPLDSLLPKVIKRGETVDLVICADAKTNLDCFPNRTNHKPFSTPKLIDGHYLPMVYAVDKNKVGVIKARDFRGIQVLAAYSPIGDSGLGLVEKIDQNEIYNPIKKLMLKILSITAVMLLFGYILILKQLKPLVSLVVEEHKKAVEEHKKAESEKANFIAATEGGIDNFYIFEAVRNYSNNIVDFRCLFLNTAGSKLINKSPGEMIGKLLLEEVPINREKYLFDKYKYVIDTGKTISEELLIDNTSINATWIYWQIVKLGDGMAITSRDITEKKKLEYELTKANQLHSAILESASYSIIATDENGIIISMNKAAERMLWYSEDELAGKFTPEIIHDKEEIILKAEKLSLELGRTILPGFEVFVAQASINISYEDEWIYVRKDGSRFPVKLSFTVLKDINGNIYGYLGIAYDISEQKRAKEYITHIALHDVLTGLPNRALFDDRVKLAIEGAKRKEEKLGIALLDLDYFKRVNDSLGHHIGDKLLQVVSDRLVNSIRATDTVARMGGDEFAFLFPNITHPEGSNIILQRIHSSFTPNVDVSNHVLHATPSIGMAVYPDDGEDLDALLKNADTAMYRVKELGRNGYQIFDKQMLQLATLRMTRELDLREAVDKQQFELFYQPQINLDSLAIVGVEALIRWQKSPGVFISPAEFIPLAEETGLILPIGDWVIREAIMQAKKFESTFGRPIRMAVNISPRQFRQAGLVSNIFNTLKEFDVSPNTFEVEITENLMMENIESTVEVMRGLAKGGVKIALDDFGTGYSSLSYLSKFKFDRIKIDQSFIKNCLIQPQAATLVKTIINLSNSLGIEIIAEGVETKEQLDFITLHQCGDAQGYYIGRPVPAGNIVDKTY